MSLYFIGHEEYDLMVQAASFELTTELWLEHCDLGETLSVGAFTETRPNGPFLRLWTVVNPEPHRAQSLSWEHKIGHSGPENRMQLLGFYPLEDVT